MKAYRFARFALLFLAFLLFQTDKFMASAATVPPGACLYALDPTADRAFQIAGAQSVYSACGVVSESSANDGFEMEGAETLYLQNHAQVSVVGGAQLNGQTYLWDTIGNKQVQAVKVSNPGDPLASIALPASGTVVSKSPAYFDMNSKPANNTLSPGVYCGGLTIGNTNGTAFTLSPGVYIMAGGGLTLNSQAVVKGTGVTVYNTSSAGWGCSSSYSYKPITISGQVTATLSAPTSGAFDGILFFGNRTGCSTKGSCIDQINGGSTAILNGALYFASDEIEITGSNASGYMMLVADKIYINGTSTIGNNGNPFDGITVNVSPAAATLFASQTQQFTATVSNNANPAVTWTISPAGVGSISSSGLYAAPSTVVAQQTVTITATSQADNAKSATATVTLAVTLTPQTISFANPGAQTVGRPSTLTATATSGLPVSFASTTAAVCTVSGTAATFVSSGSCTITASQAGNTTYAAAVPVMQSFPVNGEAQTISFPAITAQTVGKPLTLTATASSNLPVSFASTTPAVCTVSGTTATFLATGTCTIDANQAGNSSYASATMVPQSFPVNGAGQTISFTAPASPVTYGVAPVALTATASSGLPVSFSVLSGPGAISGSTLTITGASTVVVAANQAGNSGYAAAAQATASVVVNPAVLTVTAANAIRAYGAANPVFTDTITGFVNGDTASVVSGAASLTTTATAGSAAGSYPIAAAMGTLSAANYSFSFVAGTLTVSTAAQTISFTAPASPVTYGVVPVALSATASSGLPVSFSVVSGPGSISGSTLTITGAGTVVVAANQAGNGEYAAAAQATASVVVNPAVLTVTAANAIRVYGAANPVFTDTITGFVNGDTASVMSGAASLTTAATASSAAGTYPITAAAGTLSAANYSFSFVAGTLTVTSSTPCTSSGYSYERAITIDHTKVPNTDQTNFPFLFNTTDPLLATTANGGHVANPNGYDIIFTSDPAGQNILNFEMEEYDPVHGQVIAWIQIPTLSHTSDTVVYVFYGNSNVIASQQNPTGVWDSNYMGVWHVANHGGVLSLADSASYGDSATNDGATATAGQIDGGMSTDGTTYATIGTPTSLANLPQGNATFSAWVNTAVAGNGGVIMGKEDPDYSSAGWALWTSQNTIYFESIYSDQDLELASSTPTGDGIWSYVVVTLAGSPTQGGQATVYINGVPSGTTSSGSGPAGDDSAQTAYLGNASWSWPLQGLSDEFRISNTIRSSDWIATEYTNQSTPSAFYVVSTENVAINPVSTILYGGQGQQFTAIPLSTCYTSVNWSQTPAGLGTLTASGFYTAPTNIDEQQTVTITATIAGDSTKWASAIVTLMPPVAVHVSPAGVTLSNGSQPQQFTANVINSVNTQITWTISPAGMGSIDANGLYVAPPSFTGEQTVTITATSQFDTTKSDSATITLSPAELPPPQCGSNGYSYQRAISIDHTQVPHTDQTNFPFLFNTTDPAFATTANGGHVTNFNGNDIIFSTDPSGLTKLDHELEEYNPVTGQVIAWVRIPILSHTSDTILYVFYGNSSIASPQQNPTGVWDNSYMGVWHVANPGGALSLADSTSNGNNATNNGATATAGQIDGGMVTDGSAYATVGNSAGLTNLAQGNATFSAWVNTAPDNYGTIIANQENEFAPGWSFDLDYNTATFVVGTRFDGFSLSGEQPTISGAWSYVAVTIDQNAPQNGQANIYINGMLSGTTSGVNGKAPDDSGGIVTLAQGLTGSTDEFRISNTVRSADWIAAEYNNQSSPSAFYALYPENTVEVVPAALSLYASQSQQFSVAGTCNSVAVTWTASPDAPNTISASGLYAAPSSIASQQTFTVTATSQADGSTVGSATVTLMPPVTVNISPSAPTLYASYETEQLTASVVNATNTAVTWSITPSGLGTIDVTGIYTAPRFNNPQTVTITATSQADSTQSASATLTLMPVMVTPNYSWSLIWGGFSQQYTANLPVSWSASPAGAGTISASGLFTASTNIPSIQLVTITATSLVDPNAVATVQVNVGLPASSLTPLNATLIGGQTMPFDVCMATSATNMQCDPSVATWSISPAGTGTISSSGLYTAPATVVTSQTVVITASDLSDPGVTLSTTLTLVPPALTVTPSSLTLYSGESEQFFAPMTNSSSTAVNWSMAPVGAGSISASGVYKAPIGLTAQQTVTITATSQAIPSLSASAVITLSPTQCAGKAYGYMRSIAIDHTKVPNTDQTNFPFLFSAMDPAFASVANGGHVTSPSGDDILFSSDSGGMNRLDYEIEEYNPATGQIIAWVRIPTLAHATDTVIYMFYGNSSVTAAQQNPAGVWENGYQSVYHLADAGSGIAADSTGYGNNIPTNGLTSAQGDFDVAAGFNGATSYFELPSADFASYPPGYLNTNNFAASFGVWFKTSSEGMILEQATGTVEPGEGLGGNTPALWVDSSGNLRGSFFSVYDGNASAPQLVTQTAFNDNQWHLAALTYDNGTETLYVDGQIIGFDQNTVESGNSYYSPYSYLVGTGYSAVYQGVNLATGWHYLNGTLEEIEVSTIARSGDWLQTEYFNQSSPATYSALSPEVSGGISLNPLATSLYAGQSQQFTVFDQAICGSSGAAWSMPTGSLGALSSDGRYTAPPTIETQQTVTIAATTLGVTSATIAATVTLLPKVTISVTPPNLSLTSGQSQQFTALVSNTSNKTVGWTISPANAGTMNRAGLYTAPASLTALQTVTITATSQADPVQSASATITLSPAPITPIPPSSPQCGSSGSTSQRVIVIDHTKVPNTDQSNFPFLFNTVDTDLATTANGGSVVSATGDDIYFSLDPNGLTKLDHEIEEYNPGTGQLIAWVRIPTLSHTTDTVLYLFYGNPSIMSPLQNPQGVWDSNYEAVYHLANITTSNAADSTAYGNIGMLSSISTATGQIDGAAALNGASSYLQIPSTAFPSYPAGAYDYLGIEQYQNSNGFSASFGIWFKTASWGGLLDQTAGQTCGGGFCVMTSPEEPGDQPDGSWGSMLDINWNGSLEGRGINPTTQAYNDNHWHFAVVTFENGVNKLYADGQLVETGNDVTFGFDSSYAYFVGTEYPATDDSTLDQRPWIYLNGEIDDISVSNVARSGDWIQAGYNNQASPSTFYSLSSLTSVKAVPPVAALFPTQSQQFAASATCNADLTWTMPSGAQGTLTPSGLYTAPESIATQQIVTVTATGQNGTDIGSAVVDLLPSPTPIRLAAPVAPPYASGTAQTFVATLQDQNGIPESAVTVTFTVLGANSTVGSAITGNDGTASYTYTGANIGTDTIQATAIINDQLQSSSTITALWTVQTPPIAVASITLLPQPTLGRGGLVGAFTDSSGTVIEPLAIGAAARTFVVPAGATQLQLGIDDNYYEDNGGSGFVVAINGIPMTKPVPPTAMPWKWKTGGLNNNYQYGINDGTDPLLAATDLIAGQDITVAYQSGTVSTDSPSRPLVDAGGEQTFISGTKLWQGAYFPTMYTTATSYPEGLPITVSAVVTDASGAPVPNVQVTLSVNGANPGTYQAISDATGTAAFSYAGQYAGIDTLQAEAVLTGDASVSSSLSNINWALYQPPPQVGTLGLYEIGTNVNSQSFVSYAKDANGNAFPNVNVGYYVTGVDSFQTSGTTNDIGESAFAYYHLQAGNYKVIAVDSIGRNVIVTPAYNGNWVVPPSTPCPTCKGGTITVGISAGTTVTMPNPLQLNGSVTDSSSTTTTDTWTEVSGPGTVTFADPSNPITTAIFSQVGTYVLQLSAFDGVNSGWAQSSVTVTQPSTASESQGWIETPVYGSAVTGIVPITLASGITLQPSQSETLIYYPANNPSNVTPLPLIAQSNTISSLDTTTLVNGTYFIQLNASDTSGAQQYSLVQVTVVGNYKPGRLTTVATELVVPAAGIPINIQRQYDSLNAGTSSDFGYGWSLGINTNLVVDPAGNVTFTLGGQRRTFNLTPQMTGCSPLLGCLFPYYWPVYTPEPGLHGTLTDSGMGCPGLDMLVPDGSLWLCQGGGQFTPTVYIYTDPNGTAYTIGAGGALQSIQDKNGNGLTVTPNGIISSTGLSVPFVRDSQNRITQITDPQGNIYSYSYDTNGNLASVTYPNSTTPRTYTYDANHLYRGGTDALGYPLPITQYYQSTIDSSGECQGDCDPNGLQLNNRLKNVTDALGEITSYTYDLTTNTTTVTNPQDANGNSSTETWVYDSYGMVLSHVDPLGNITSNAYDANHNLTSTTDPLSHTTTYTYDANGNRTSTTSPATSTSVNTTSTSTYNQYSEQTSATDELGNVRTFNYDANYNPQSTTDSLGVVASFLFSANGTLQAGAVGYDLAAQPARASQFSYDAYGSLISSTDALGRTTTHTYNSLGQKTSMTLPPPNGSTAGSTTTYQYDAVGNLVQTNVPLGNVTTSLYDANGNRTSSTDPDGNVTTYKYDALDRLIEVDYPSNSTTPASRTTKTYDFRNNVITSTDQAGNVTLNTYDKAGRLISVTRGYGSATPSTTSYTYYADGRKWTETDALGHTTTNYYDNAGRLITVTDAAGSTQYVYDDAGNQISSTDPKGNTTHYQYDARKRLIETDYPATADYPDGTSVKNAYDAAGNVISVTDQANNVVQSNYDAANQLTSVVQVDSPNSAPYNTTTYAYDNDGNQTAVTDENGHTTQSAYDALNRLRSTTLPDGSLNESRLYDAAGNLTSLTDFNGKTTTFAYDALNRLLSRTPDPSLNEPTVSFTYTLTGQRHTMTDASGTTTYSYDSLDRLTSKVTPEGTLSYTYDAAGNVASIVSSNTMGINVSYTYDDLGRLQTVVDNRLTGNNTTTYSYDAGSNLKTATYPNYPSNDPSAFAYDSLDRLTGVSTPVSSYSYQLSLTGNRKSVTEGTGRTLNWTYDNIYRLTSETVSNDPANKDGYVSYSLDPVGNRKSSTSTLSGVSPESFTYSTDDELTTDSYDNNGNTTHSGVNSYNYDSQNHLISMNGTVAMLYDGDGNRVAKTVNNVTTRYLVDDLNPTGYPQVVEELVNNTVQRQYTYGLERISENQFVNSTWTPSFYGQDGSGSVRQLTNAADGVTDTYDYDAFGNKVNSTGTTPNNYLYRGEQYDSDLGLYYLRARYYNPVTGRFLNVDPMAGQGQRRYEYAAADPVNGKDPSGNFVLESYWPLHAPLLVGFHLAIPSWCGNVPASLQGLFGSSCIPPYHRPKPLPPPSDIRLVPSYDQMPGDGMAVRDIDYKIRYLDQRLYSDPPLWVNEMIKPISGVPPLGTKPVGDGYYTSASPSSRPNQWHDGLGNKLALSGAHYAQSFVVSTAPGLYPAASESILVRYGGEDYPTLDIRIGVTPPNVTINGLEVLPVIP